MTEGPEPLEDIPPEARDSVLAAESEPMKTAEAVRERLSEIPTRLYLPSECDRELLSVAAAKLVAKYRQPILDFLNRQP